MLFKDILLKNNFFTLLSFLDFKRIYEIYGLLLLTLISGISEIFILGSLVPFLAVINDPESIFNLKFIGNFFKNVELSNSYIVFITTAFFIFSILFASVIRMIVYKLNFNLSAKIGNDLSNSIYLKTISQPYKFHIFKNSNLIITTITTHIEYTVNFIPKTKIEIAVDKSAEEAVVSAIKSTSETGKIGDGKIFVLDLQEAIRIRTGETGSGAL